MTIYKESKVKDIIQGLWIGDKLSRFEYNSIKSYLNQGYDYHLYTYGNVTNIPKGVTILDGNTILDKKYIFYYEGLIAPFSDLFRYKLLLDKGGIWTDCDIICLRKLPKENNAKYIFVSERTILKGAFASCLKTSPFTCKKKKVLNSFIRAPRGSELMKIMYEKSLQYREIYLKNKLINKQISKSSNTKKNNIHKTNKTNKIKNFHKNIGLKSYHWGGGSKTLETYITKLGLETYITEPEFAFPVNWWDFKYVFKDIDYILPSRGWDEGTKINNIFHNKNTYLITIHNGWLRNQKLDKNAKYHDNSLYEKLDKFINL